jgi:hypothetical protein
VVIGPGLYIPTHRTLLAAQRLSPQTFGWKSDAVMIGGHVQHTVLTPDQITTRILHRWPDEIGKRIGMKT